jgi:serine/threonine protein kinase
MAEPPNLEGQKVNGLTLSSGFLTTRTSVLYRVADDPSLCFKYWRQTTPEHSRRSEMFANQSLRGCSPRLICATQIARDPFHPLVPCGLFMKWCRRGDLFEFVTKNHVPEDTIRHIFFDVILALEAIHAKNWAHRAIQPENIFLDGPDDAVVPDAFLGDLSFAKEFEAGFTDPVGAPLYCAPELIRGERFDPSVDIWAFGATLFVAFAKTAPFLGDPLTNSQEYLQFANEEEFEMAALEAANVSDDAKALISACLRAVPGNRPSATQVKTHKFFQPLNR